MEPKEETTIATVEETAENLVVEGQDDVEEVPENSEVPLVNLHENATERHIIETSSQGQP